MLKVQHVFLDTLGNGELQRGGQVRASNVPRLLPNGGYEPAISIDKQNLAR